MSLAYLGHILGITNGKTWLVLVLVSGDPGATEGFRRASTLGPLRALLEVQVEHETCRTIHGKHLESISSQKNGTGLARGVSGGQVPTEGFRRASTFRPLLALVEARVEHVNIFDNKWPTR